MEGLDPITKNNIETTKRNGEFIAWLQKVETALDALGVEAILEVEAPQGEIFVLPIMATVVIPALGDKPYTLAFLHMDLRPPEKMAKTIVVTLTWKNRN